MLFFKNGLFVVGPESAGAHPGAAAFRKGGPLTITDANLFLGRLLPDHFPKIFGKNQDEGLDVDTTARKFAELTEQINEYFVKQGKPERKMSAQDVALGFVIIANEAMCRPIRALTQSKGYDIQRHTLSCFGGAGGQHATAIARNLGVSTIFLHRFSGILSAYGLGLADIVQEVQEPCTKELLPENMDYVLARVEELKKKAAAELHKYGFDDDHEHGSSSSGEGGANGHRKSKRVQCQVYLNLRYAGTDTSVMTTLHDASSTAAIVESEQQDAAGEGEKAMEIDEGTATPAAAAGSGRKKSARAAAASSKAGSGKKKGATAASSSASSGSVAAVGGSKEVAAYMRVFVSRYQREFGFTLNRPVIIDDIRVRGIGHTEGVKRVPIAEAAASHRPKPHQVVKTFFEADSKAAASGAGTVGRLLDTSVFLLSSLHAQDRIIGPAIIIDKTSSTLIEPECTAHVNLYGDLEIYVGKPDEGDDDDTPEALAAAEAKRAAEEAAAAKAEEEEIELDNIQLSIFAHRFMSIAEQCGRTLQRTSISTNIKERLSVPKPSTVCAFDSRCCAVFAHC
jgi:5-oxoprolinase (ATP-hydrolysing)